MKDRDDPRLKALEPYKFKPGECGNPNGRPKVAEDVRQLMKEKSDEYRRKFLHWCDAPIDDIIKCKADWPVTGMDRMITSALVKAFNGDSKAFNAILDRILGKAVQPLEHTGADGAPLFPDIPKDDLAKAAVQLASRANISLEINPVSRHSVQYGIPEMAAIELENRKEITDGREIEDVPTNGRSQNSTAKLNQDLRDDNQSTE